MIFKLKILGSSSAQPTTKRFTTAQVINLDSNYFLIDCGEGTQIRLQQYKFSLLKINHIFISHLHADHFLGILGILSTLSLIGKKTDLHIYAHKHLENLLTFYTNFVGKQLKFKWILHPLSDTFEMLFEDSRCSIYSFPVNHGKIPSCGFLFKTKEYLNLKKEAITKYQIPISFRKKIKEGADFKNTNNQIIPNNELTIKIPFKSYAYCADTLFYKPIIEFIKGVDLLYHEATFSEKEKKSAAKFFHSTAKEAATMAKLVNTKKLLIGHFSTRFKDINELLQEAKKVFSNTIAVNDGDSFDI